MQQAKQILNASVLWRALMAMCLWFGRQWQRSGVVQWFLHPPLWEEASSRSSIFFRLWSWFRGILCRIYYFLHLDRLFAGSVFLKVWVWCALPVVLAPVLPTMAVLGLAAIGYASLLLNLVHDPSRPLVYSPINRYVILYAAVYLAGTLFSVNRAASLKPGLLSVAFILFAVVLYNSVTGRRQLDTLIVLVVLLFTFRSAGMPVLLILVIQGSIWINFSIPAFTGTPLFFLSYLVVSSIQMGANIDYAIVIASRYMELKDQMDHRQAIIETMNFAFPTIVTSGSILTVAGLLIGQMTSEAAIVGIGQSLGRGTILSIVLVMFVLPQILLIGGAVVEKTSFSVPSAVKKHRASGRVRVDGLVRGEISGTISGTVHAIVDGDVDLNLISGYAQEEAEHETQEN